MPSLLDLPDRLLADIVDLVLKLPNARKDGIDRSAKKISTVLNAKARSLLLCSRHINAIATRQIFTRSFFKTRNIPALRHFVDLLGNERLELVRNVQIHLDYDRTQVSQRHWGMDVLAAPKDFEDVADQLKRLPPRLRRLYLRPPFCVFAVSNGFLVEALQRFRHLEELLLPSDRMPLSLSMFSGMTTTEVPSSPMFPNLRKLQLEGIFQQDVSAEAVTKAFSQAQLPALQTLTINVVVYGDDPEKESCVFLPEAILGMNPLTKFKWTDNAYQRGPTVRPPPPTRAYLKALKKRHGTTLRKLWIDYGHTLFGMGAAGYDPDVEAEHFIEILDGIPNLKNVHVSATPDIFITRCSFCQYQIGDEVCSKHW